MAATTFVLDISVAVIVGDANIGVCTDVCATSEPETVRLLATDKSTTEADIAVRRFAGCRLYVLRSGARRLTVVKALAESVGAATVAAATTPTAEKFAA